ncbi:hypothetical protein HYU11_05610 [Candidatus Woesearchaeota archaeon]|nr:hypothetical protein [Candidatus Woesearchaeota archaeon]
MKPMLSKTGSVTDLKKGGFLYEPKLDGIRALCKADQKGITITSRNEKDITARFPEFRFRANISAKSCILDGEIVSYDENGIPSFQILQEGAKAHYAAFDILEKNGKNLTGLPLSERKLILESTVNEGEGMQKVPYTKNGEKLWKLAKKMKVEGIMAKGKESTYYPGIRTDRWLKIKLHKTIDCIVTGYTSKKREISALALGLYEKGKMKFIGKVGTGFTEDFFRQLRGMLKKTGEKEGITTVEPELVCEVKYSEFTKAGKLRSPVFVRLRPDKAPEECERECF